ncbi:MAG: hypothetical protein EPN56_14195 [Rhodanobacter sp.]|nr:MAG: hypothetical protein EPN78_08690 [Rhodanobacter sp.]TAM10055.1 MAG: hypothetical protein EPN66_10795 [Rhodanobacter sp.]TAM34751.1 MAG: hypothetical protein EPN56_14195 [Rhodanobacter sp.]
MIFVSIASDERSLQDANPDWITQQVERRRRDGLQVCVTVIIKSGGLDMRLSTPECVSRGGSRAPTAQEAHVFNLWTKFHLNQPGWSPGNLIAFLRQLDR